MHEYTMDDGHQAVRDLVAARTGVRIRDSDAERFCELVNAHMNNARAVDIDDYLHLLEREPLSGSSLWDRLIVDITVGESYFFRDKGQFELLEYQILPELIERNKTRRQLRIWSAGCSTGEEPYSIAILLDRLLPSHQHWDLVILGTDINHAALAQAKRGLFREWSFRGVDPRVRNQYFSPQGRDWAVEAQIRAMVSFQRGNLVMDRYPNLASRLYEMDLVICRNVFIYFDGDTTAQVLGKLCATLKDGGYLMTAHNELSGRKLGALQARMYPESVVYQRVPAHGACAPGRAEEMTPSQRSRPPRSAMAQTGRRETPGPVGATTAGHQVAESPSRTGDCAVAIELAGESVEEIENRDHSLLKLAQTCANLGQYDEAAEMAQAAIRADALDHRPYYLLAHVEELRSNDEAARDLFRKVIYLNPSFVPAYLDLAARQERDGIAAKARAMRKTALDLLQDMPPDAVIEPYEDMTADELIRYVARLVDGA